MPQLSPTSGLGIFLLITFSLLLLFMFFSYKKILIKSFNFKNHNKSMDF
nr:ATP synthase F0 subunit 8 [Lymnaea stagnalis]